jgi:DNA-binding IclR family transcriptional regulator
MKLFLLGNAHPPLRRLTSQAQPLLDIIARDTGQSIHLAALEHISAIIVAQASSPGNWEFRLKMGAALDLLSTSSGKALLAFQDDIIRKELISLIVENSNINLEIDESELFKELDLIKESGYRISASGQLFGVTDISVPILGNDGNAFGVITCPHIERIDQANENGNSPTIEEICKLVIELANELSISQKFFQNKDTKM